MTGLWILCLLDQAFGAWLLAVRYGEASCSGLLCTIITLDGQPTWALVLAVGCAVALVVLIPVNSGAASIGSLQLAAVVVAAVCGAVALAGVAVLLVGLVVALALAVGILFFVVERL